MPITVANTLTTSTFDFWRNRTNELAHSMTNFVVTVDSNTATGNAVVNGTIQATTLIANTVRGGTIASVGTLTIASNLSITSSTLLVGNATSNVVITPNSFTLSNASFVTTGGISLGNASANVVLTGNSVTVTNGSVVVSSGNITVSNATSNVFISPAGVLINGVSIFPLFVNTSTTGTTAQLVDSFTFSTHRGAEYVLVVKDSLNANVQINKIILVTDGLDSYITEYAVVSSNVALGSYSANANATHARLYFTPVPNNTTIKGEKTLVTV